MKVGSFTAEGPLRGRGAVSVGAGVSVVEHSGELPACRRAIVAGLLVGRVLLPLFGWMLAALLMWREPASLQPLSWRSRS